MGLRCRGGEGAPTCTHHLTPLHTVGREGWATPTRVPAPGPYRLWPGGPGRIMAVRGEVEVISCPLLLTLLAGGLGPTPGQGEGEQAWVPITTTGTFIIQLTLRGGPGPGRAKGGVRAMGQPWVRVGGSLNPPSSQSQGRHPAEPSDREEGRRGREGATELTGGEAEIRGCGSRLPGDSLPSPSLPRPCLLGGNLLQIRLLQKIF